MVRASLAALAAALFAACGSGGSDPPPPIGVSISPAEVTLAPGATQAFTAAVTNAADTRVTWSVEEAAGGTIGDGGLYTAPAAEGTWHVAAASVADPSRRATAAVHVVAPPADRRTVTVVRRGAGGGLEGVPGVAVHRASPAGAHVETVTTGADGVADFGPLDAARATYTVRLAAGGDELIRSWVDVPPAPLTIRLDALPGGAGHLADVAVTLDPPATWDAFALAPSGRVEPAEGGLVVPITRRDVQADGRVTLVAGKGGIESDLRCGAWLDAPLPSGATAITVADADPPYRMGFTASERVSAALTALRRGVAFTDLGTSFFATSGTLEGCVGLLPGVERWSVAARTPAAFDQVLVGYDAVDTARWREARAGFAGNALPEVVDLEPSPVAIGALGLAAGALAVPTTGGAPGPDAPDLVAAAVRWTEGGGARRWEVIAPASRADDLALPDVPGASAPVWASGVDLEADVIAVEGAAGFDDAWAALRAGGDVQDLLRAAAGATTTSARATRRTPGRVISMEGYDWERFGTIRSADGQIDCGAGCTGQWPAGTTVRLTASANPGASFWGWGGDCTAYGNATAIDVLLSDRNVACRPIFRPATDAAYSLTVAIAGGWPALVTSDDGRIRCGDTPAGEHFSACSAVTSSGYGVTLTAAPAMTTVVFDIAWRGDCEGTGGSTRVYLDRSRACSAELTPHPPAAR